MQQYSLHRSLAVIIGRVSFVIAVISSCWGVAPQQRDARAPFTLLGGHFWGLLWDPSRKSSFTTQTRSGVQERYGLICLSNKNVFCLVPGLSPV